MGAGSIGQFAAELSAGQAMKNSNPEQACV